MISLAYKISLCLSANHNPELRCVICAGVTLFALVSHLNCTALSQSESSNFFICIIIIIINTNIFKKVKQSKCRKIILILEAIIIFALKKTFFQSFCMKYLSLLYINVS